MPWIEIISGSSASFSLKHRVFNLFLFASTLISLLNWVLISFFILDSPVLLHALTVVFFAACYYLGRFRATSSPSFIVFVTIGAIIILGSGFFLNSGSDGKILPAFLCSFTIFFLCTERALTWIVTLLHIVGLAISLTLKFIYPEWVINHYSVAERFVDNLIFLLLLLLLLFLILSVIRMSIDVERRSLRNKDSYLNQQNLLIQDLMRELNHRVKNNLQVISALLSLQAYRAQNPEAISALNEGRSRLESMSLLHKKLYQDNFFNQIALGEYIDDLINHILGDNNVSVKRSVDNIMLTADQAIPLGLILNEIFTNIRKGLKEEEGESLILIKTKIDSKNVRIYIKDNSQHNIQEFLDVEKPNVGKELIEMLVRQLDGSCRIKVNKQEELEIRIKFKLIY